MAAIDGAPAAELLEREARLVARLAASVDCGRDLPGALDEASGGAA